MSPIRVLRIIARMNVGGPAAQVAALSDGLDPARFEQRLISGDVAADEADYVELRAPHIEAMHVPGLGRRLDPSSDARALSMLRKEMREFQPHIVHTHTAKAGLLGRTAAMLARVPTRVHTFHGHLLHGYFTSAQTGAIVAVERLYAKRTTRLVATGQRVRDELIDAGIGRPSQYTIVAPGIRLPEVPPRDQARAVLGVPVEASLVAYVGRITKVKRPDRLAALVRRIVETHPETMFIVAGGGDRVEALRAELAVLGSQVRFLGWRRDVETIYSAADVVTLTSDNEGMPVSLIEAASAGCPAVTTRVGSADEVVLDGETGFVTDCDPESLARAIARILDDPELRERLGRAARAHAAAQFSCARLVADTTALYEELVTRD